MGIADDLSHPSRAHRGHRDPSGAATVQGRPRRALVGEPDRAVLHLRRCVELDPKYSAAWKLLGKALQADDDIAGARQAWQQGIAAAVARGDKQAEKEMTLFLRRLDKLTPD